MKNKRVTDAEHVRMLNLKERYGCPYFRILIMGRANAGKTTILEKVCGVVQGTKSIIYDENGVEQIEPIEPKPKLLTRMKHLLGKKPAPKSPAALTPAIEVSEKANVDISIIDTP